MKNFVWFTKFRVVTAVFYTLDKRNVIQKPDKMNIKEYSKINAQIFYHYGPRYLLDKPKLWNWKPTTENDYPSKVGT